VALPQVQSPAAAAKAAREPLPNDTATILLVDDAPSVRSVSRAMLEGAGYQVLEAPDGSSALELVRERGDHFDLVVSDVVMPGMSGRQLAASIADLRPGMPVVLMSGYTETYTDEPDGLLLRKPYTREALLARVGAELGPSPSAGPMTCLVADDHPSVLVAISGALAAHGFEVVAEAQNGRDALAKMKTFRPAIAIVDARMPELDGIELARSAAQVAPETAVIVYSGFAERLLVDRALASGARGFVLKGAPLADLVRAVEVVAAGGIYINPHVAGLRPTPDAPTLTPREEQVLRLVADGMTNHEIAARLSISSETVQTHVRRAMTKLDAGSRTQAVAKALRSSLIP
jgi:two-component system nitrate/nitrite response regulator NarL